MLSPIFQPADRRLTDANDVRRDVAQRSGVAQGFSPAVAALKGCATTVIVLGCLLAGGCAASTASRHGLEAERLQDYDRAVVEYQKALSLKPGDATTRLALQRAKLRASEEHFQRGRRLAAAGKAEEALRH